MKKDLFFTVLFFFLSLTCISVGAIANSSCSSNVSNITQLEVGDCEQDVNWIDIYPEGIYDFVYDNGIFYIEYSDEDTFDMERIAEEDDSYSKFSQYIIIECDKNTFFEYLTLYSSWYSEVNNKRIDSLEKELKSFNIKEVITDVEGGKNYHYYLCKKE